jgi:hypothetical protein
MLAGSGSALGLLLRILIPNDKGKNDAKNRKNGINFKFEVLASSGGGLVISKLQFLIK